MDRNKMTRCPTHPGEILRVLYMEPLGLGAADLATRLGVESSEVEGLISGRLSMTADMALRLSQAFNTTPESWLDAQRNVDVWQARQGQQAWRRIQPICTPIEQLESA